MGRCGELYRALLKGGIDPVVADLLELWQIAELFHNPETSPKDKSDDLLRARAHAGVAAGDNAAEDFVPEIPNVSQQQVDGLMAAFNG